MFSALASLHAETAPLAKLSQQEQPARIASDLAAVRIYRDGLRSVTGFIASRPDLFPPENRKERRTPTREDRETIWNTWKSFLDYTLALDAIGQYHRQYYRLPREEEDRSFLVAYAAFLTQYRAALEFIDRMERGPTLDTLLNEPVPEIGLPKGTYARLKFRFLNVGRGTEFVALEAIYKAKSGTSDPEIRKGIGEDRKAIWAMGRGRGEALTVKNALKVVQNAGFTAYFPVQAGISEWMGDTKVRRRGVSLVSEEQIADLTKRLEPGDILLTRHEWYLSNIGLPGFWPHAVLFIGTPGDRGRYLDDPDVKAWIQSQGQADGDFDALLRAKEPQAWKRSAKPLRGEVTRALEAISDGVAFNSMEGAADADSIVALRPRCPKREKAQAIVRAFHYAGRPYDFNFDFRTDSELVCTELVFKSYEPSKSNAGLRLPLIEMLGRPLLPANEIARQFDAAYGTKEQQLDFVLFLDGYEKQRRAVEADVEAFRQSWRRPKWHVLTQEKMQEE